MATEIINVRVRPLVWEGRRSGDYAVKQTYGQGPKPYMMVRGSKIISWHDTEDDGRAAAQVDHNARVLAFIEPSE